MCCRRSVAISLETEEKIRDILVGCGLQETISYSLTTVENHDKFNACPLTCCRKHIPFITLLNPLSARRNVMRRYDAGQRAGEPGLQLSLHPALCHLRDWQGLLARKRRWRASPGRSAPVHPADGAAPPIQPLPRPGRSGELRLLRPERHHRDHVAAPGFR